MTNPKPWMASFKTKHRQSRYFAARYEMGRWFLVEQMENGTTVQKMEVDDDAMDELVAAWSSLRARVANGTPSQS